jgi:hypothetical protein
VPGIAALSNDGRAEVKSVSCASAGNCSAGGYYTDSSGHDQAFVVNEVSGTWRQAQEAPGTAALNQHAQAIATSASAHFGAYVNSVSCGSPGNCSAGGSYTVSSGAVHAFVISEADGAWRQAEQVPGIAALGNGRAEVKSVSCASAGNCSAGGYYTDGSYISQAFVVSQVNGTWQQSEQVPGTGARNQVPNPALANAELESVSCASAGNCSAGGQYADGSGQGHAFVASQVNGTWQQAQEVPGTAALSQGQGPVMSAQVTSVSCASAGDCSAGGDYTDGSGNQQAFVVSQVNGTWQQAQEVPGTAALNQGGNAGVQSVSCASAGNCSAGGAYFYASAGYGAFVVSEVNGTWEQATEVPGTAAASTATAQVTSLSCASAGNCAAGGSYTDAAGQGHALVVSQVNGAWQQARELPGSAALSQDGDAGVQSVSCASAGNCSAGGFVGSPHNLQAFLASSSAPSSA